jgi:hypothetical protein
MADQNRKDHPEIQPNIRPRLDLIKGDGATSAPTGSLRVADEENDSVDKASNLSNQEQRFGILQGDGEDTSGPKGNLSLVSDKENEAPDDWKTNVTNNNGKLGKSKKKKTPTAIITTVLLGGSLGLGGLFSTQGMLIHIKEAIVNKLDSMSSVVEARSNLILPKRMFTTTASCTIKIRCRFNGMTTRQMKRLTIQGAQLVDAEGRPVTQNKITRKWTGGKTLILPTETGPKLHITAENYPSMLVRSSELRAFGRSVYAPLFWSLNDKVARSIRTKNRLPENPNVGEEGNKEDAEKNILQQTRAEDGPSATAEEHAKTTEDANGKTVNVPQDPGSVGVDLGPDADAIRNLTDELEAKITAGEPIDPIPNTTTGAALMDDFETPASAAKGLKSVVGLLNPLGLFTGLCTVYQMTNITVLIAKTIALGNKMRFGSIMLSAIDRLKASEGTSGDAENIANIFETADESGQTFGDSFAYHFVEYGEVATDIPLTASAEGNDVIRTLSTIIHTVNDALGGRQVVSGACNILTNPIVQGALVLTTFIPGGGAVAETLGKVAAKGGMATAKKLIEEKISGLVAKTLSKDALKAATKSAARGLGSLATSPSMALFLGSFLMGKYGIPYIANVIAGSDLSKPNGMTAMDTTTTGYDAINSKTAQSRALTPLSKKRYAAFKQFNDSSTAAYVADMRAQSNPMDLSDPYSAGNSLASAFFSLGSHLNISKNLGNILTAPSAILSSINPSKFLASNALAADPDAETAYCQDDYLQSKEMATSPFCNVKYGFNDVNMLKTADPQSGIADLMRNQNQVDDNGDPVPGSDYEKFQTVCVDNTDGKFIGDIGDPAEQIDESCYDPAENDSAEVKQFRIYDIDTDINESMDTDTSNSTPEPNGTDVNVQDLEAMNPTTSQQDQSIASSPDIQQILSAALTNVASALSTPAFDLACINAASIDTLSDFKPYSIPPAGSRSDLNNWELGYNA